LKVPSKVETINDIDGNIVNFFKVLRDKPSELADLIEFTPWSRQEYTELLTSARHDEYFLKTGDSLEDARRFLVRMWQGFGSKTSDRTGWRHDIQGRNGSNCAREWLKLPERIVKAAQRLKLAQIECQPAIKLIERYRFSEVLIYADPPYPLSTRSKRMYANEMTDADHEELLEALDRHSGPVLLSGYACKLYDSKLQHWERKSAKARSEGGREREEVLWLNPVAAKSQRQTLFG